MVTEADLPPLFSILIAPNTKYQQNCESQNFGQPQATLKWTAMKLNWFASIRQSPVLSLLKKKITPRAILILHSFDVQSFLQPLLQILNQNDTKTKKISRMGWPLKPLEKKTNFGIFSPIYFEFIFSISGSITYIFLPYAKQPSKIKTYKNNRIFYRFSFHTTFWRNEWNTHTEYIYHLHLPGLINANLTWRHIFCCCCCSFICLSCSLYRFDYELTSWSIQKAVDSNSLTVPTQTID